jgi:hypothetical protein
MASKKKPAKPTKPRKPTSAEDHRRAVELALGMKSELDQYNKTHDRSVFLKALKEQFLITRYDAASKVEKNRLVALDILLNRMTSMSDNMLIKTVQMLSDIGAVDLESIVGTGGGGKGGPMFGVQHTMSVLGQGSEGNPVKDAGQLLESLEHIAAYFRKRPQTITLTPEEEKKITSESKRVSNLESGESS